MSAGYRCIGDAALRYRPQSRINGRPYWRKGRFLFLDRPEVRALLSEYGLENAAFEQRNDIGL